MELGFVAEGAGVAEDAGTKGKTHRYAEADGDGGGLFCKQCEYGADDSSSECLAYQSGSALNAARSSRTIDRRSHYHYNVVRCLEHSESYTAYRHTPSYVPFRRIAACEKEK